MLFNEKNIKIVIKNINNKKENENMKLHKNSKLLSLLYTPFSPFIVMLINEQLIFYFLFINIIDILFKSFRTISLITNRSKLLSILSNYNCTNNTQDNDSVNFK